MLQRLFVSIGLAAILAASAAKQVYAEIPASKPVTVNLKGAKAVLQLVLLKGGKVVHEDTVCAERLEGTFAVRVKFDKGGTVSTPINDLMKEEELSFCPVKPWKIVTADYNKDGQTDFNLGQYKSINGWNYWLFTIAPSGHVSLLPMPNDAIFIADQENSTSRIKVTKEGITSMSYVMPCVNEEDCGSWETTYWWNSKLKRFEQHDRKHIAE